MIKKLIHFADLHLKMLKDHDQYREIMMPVFDQWRELKPDRIIFTGDLVHNKNQMTPELIDMMVWVLSNCASIAKTILIPGNHDFLENNMERLDAISPVLEAMENPNIVYYKDRGVYEDENIDWVVFSLYDHNIPPVIEPSNRMRIGLFHGPIISLRTDLNYEFESGFDRSQFAGCDVVFCGDIHKRQFFEYDGGKGYMIGSLIQQNYGESVNKHGYGVFDVDSGVYDVVEVHNDHLFLEFGINGIEDIEEGREVLKNDK